MRKKTLLSTFGIALAGLSLQYTTSHEVSAELVISDSVSYTHLTLPTIYSV